MKHFLRNGIEEKGISRKSLIDLQRLHGKILWKIYDFDYNLNIFFRI